MFCNFGWPQIPASEWRFFDLNITMPSLFAVLDSAQYSTARNTLMYKSLLFCQTYLECCLTAMIYRCKNVRVKQQRCYWAIMGVFWFWRRLTGSSLRAGLSRRKCRTQDQSTTYDLTNQGHAYKFKFKFKFKFKYFIASYTKQSVHRGCCNKVSHAHTQGNLTKHNTKNPKKNLG